MTHSDDRYTCRFADGSFPTINGKINSFETMEKAQSEARRWSAIEVVICRKRADGSYYEHDTVDLWPVKPKPPTPVELKDLCFTEMLDVLQRCEMWLSTMPEGRTMQLACQCVIGKANSLPNAELTRPNDAAT